MEIPQKNQKDPRPRTGDGSSDLSKSQVEAALKSAAEALPQRYVVKTGDQQSVLTCLEAPNIGVYIKAGLSISSAAAHKAASGTIYLDGVAQCEPFLDHEKFVYNLDHHYGCVRAFTLSTCEQALVMIMKGLNLRDREWKVFANDPDLDTILAIWLLFNHLRIDQKGPIYKRFLISLVRLEGIIDSLGLELRELSALPPEYLQKTQRVIDFLRSEEIRLKKDKLWGEIDFSEYTAAVLHKIDKIIYKSSDFSDFTGIDELARAELTDNRIAVVVESDTGIYELENHLNKLYGNRLGVVFLQKAPDTYTLRRMDPFMPVDLTGVYRRLNLIDPAVKFRTEGNMWGGSGDIGGSPRATGTKLTPEQIVQACRDAFRKPTLLRQSFRFLSAGGIGAGIVALSVLISFLISPSSLPGGYIIRNPDHVFMVNMLLITVVCLTFLSHRKPWLFGLIAPLGKDWWLVLPATVLAGFAGGIWLPAEAALRHPSYQYLIYMLLVMPVVSELLFRSLIHGLLAENNRIQTHQSPWFISWPVTGSAMLNTCFFAYLLYHSSHFQGFPVVDAKRLFAAFALALAAGVVRERSQSVLPACLFHIITATCVAAASYAIAGFTSPF
jgi:hypothetical protein